MGAILEAQGYPYLAVEIDKENRSIVYWDDRIENQVKIFLFQNSKKDFNLILDASSPYVSAIASEKGDVYIIDVESMEFSAFMKIDFRKKTITRYG